MNHLVCCIPCPGDLHNRPYPDEQIVLIEVDEELVVPDVVAEDEDDPLDTLLPNKFLAT